ncbi:MAG: choice-of-anchor B family protein [Bacteroidetes bacterium]|nr:choice-of-anchor B family protein [Bacteroidota bacterium]
MKKVVVISLLFLQINFVFSQLNMSLLGQFPYSGKGSGSDIWGYVDEFGNEYAIVGLQTGVSIVDVTNPSSLNEVFWTTGANTIWRDMKTWNNKAYITNEGGNGLMIIDLDPLPASTALTVTNYTGSTYPFTTAHNLYIDENGYAYIFGAKPGVGGAIILNLNVPTTDPNFEIGIYNDYYLHDGMVRGDTLWGGAINDGFFVVVDVSTKSLPITKATQATPNSSSHNCWISDDGKTLFTADEKINAYLASFDVSDITNISELDRIQSSPGMNVVAHNTHFINNFIVTSYYADGVVIHDVSDPSVMVEVGNYDTSPAFSGGSFDGCWGVYPWLPSGNIIANDIENGLYVLGVNYVRASYLKGNVTNFNTTAPINGVTVQIITSNSTSTNVIGDYKIGVATAGSYDVVFSKIGFYPDTIFNANLTSGNTTIVDMQLIPLIPFSFQVQIIDAITLNSIPNVNIRIENTSFISTVATDTLGVYTFTNFTDSNYTITAGKWGYRTACEIFFLDTSTNTITIALTPGYYDDFSFDYNWTVSGTATTGIWEIGEPVGTLFSSNQANPDFDVNSDCNIEAFITGNAGGNFTNDDVDNGETILTSPVFDATIYSNPVINYYSWFFNKGGSPFNDYMTVKLSNGTNTITIDSIISTSSGNSSWISKSVQISNYLTPTNNMRIIVSVNDIPAENIVEGGFDVFEVTEGLVSTNEPKQNNVNVVNIFPNPFSKLINVQFLNNSHTSAIQIQIVDVAGRLVDKFDFTNENNIQLQNNYKKGVYLMNIYENGLLIKNQKMIKY